MSNYKIPLDFRVVLVGFFKRSKLKNKDASCTACILWIQPSTCVKTVFSRAVEPEQESKQFWMAGAGAKNV